MALALKTDIAMQLVSKLDTLTITTADRWAMKCRYIIPLKGRRVPAPMSFRYNPWVVEILRERQEEAVFCKGAQTTITESVMLNKAFFALDQMHVNVFYALPSFSPDAQDFTTSRLNPAIAMSPYIKNMFTEADRMGLKRTAYNTLYIRGVKSDNQIKSVDTAVLLADEVDEFPERAIPLLRKRSAGQISDVKMLIACSTPSVDNYGVAAWYKDSTQEHFNFRCPHCSRFIEFKFPESLVITADDYKDERIRDSHYICYECKHPLDQKNKWEYLASGIWVPNAKSRVRGYHINELYSSAYQPWEVAVDYLKSLVNKFYEQTFYNDALGLPHIVDGAQLTEKVLVEATDNYRLGQLLKMDGIRTLGIDVGKDLHYAAKIWRISDANSMFINDNAEGRFIEIGKCERFLDIDRVISRVKPHMVVIDANPETREAKALAARHPGLVYLCYYGRDAKKENEVNLRADEISVSVNRTVWLDLTLGRYRSKTCMLPSDSSADLVEFRQHLMNLVRRYDMDTEGAEKAEYKKIGDDHYAHADNYNEVALNLVGKLGRGGSVTIGHLA